LRDTPLFQDVLIEYQFVFSRFVMRNCKAIAAGLRRDSKAIAPIARRARHPIDTTIPRTDNNNSNGG
jgi:hypothetical protein